VYYDGQMNDSQLNVAIAYTAALVGAVVLNHAEAISLKKDEVTGNVTGIVVTPDLVHTQLSDAVQQVLMRKVLLPACRNILCTSLISIPMPSHYYKRQGVSISETLLEGATFNLVQSLELASLLVGPRSLTGHSVKLFVNMGRCVIDLSILL
jgi:hypothetical protein